MAAAAFLATLPTMKPKPSARALEIAARAKEAAQAEVDRHLAAGRPVYGRHNGKPVWIYVSQIELAQQAMDWESPAARP